MSDEFYQRLLEAKERKLLLNRAERKQKELRKRLREQEQLIAKLEVQLATEQADVEELTRMSLVNLFHTILRSKDEQLELERQQALAAALKLQEAKQTLANIEADINGVGEDLMNYRDAERDLDRLMAEKELTLRSSPSSSSELAEMETQIANQTLLVKEIHEAMTAGSRVLASLEDASTSLGKAENWGKWDMWGGGGMISTHVKHNHVDDARQFIHNTNHLMKNFRDELADLKRSVEIEIDISGMLKMADYWFDGFITDWVVQGRIQAAQDNTLEAVRQVRAVVDQLRSEYSVADSSLSGMNSKRISWIEGKRLDE